MEIRKLEVEDWRLEIISRVCIQGDFTASRIYVSPTLKPLNLENLSKTPIQRDISKTESSQTQGTRQTGSPKQNGNAKQAGPQRSSSASNRHHIEKKQNTSGCSRKRYRSHATPSTVSVEATHDTPTIRCHYEPPSSNNST